jgi:hypothetical protein
MLGMSGTVAAQDGTPETASSFPVNVTFVNGLTSLDAVDVYINGDDENQRVVEGLEYGTVSETFEGSAPATLVVIKQNVNLGFDRYIFDTLVPTEAGKSYVIVISDLLILPVELDLTATGDDTARSIGVHAAAQAPAVDIYVTPAGQEFSIGDVVPLITDLSYGNATTGGPAVPGSYDLRLTQTGTDTVALEQAGVEVEAGNSYVFAIIGKPGSTEQPLTVLSVSEATQS